MFQVIKHRGEDSNAFRSIPGLAITNSGLLFDVMLVVYSIASSCKIKHMWIKHVFTNAAQRGKASAKTCNGAIPCDKEAPGPGTEHQGSSATSV